MPEYTHKNESEYNEFVANFDTSYVNLDKTDISLPRMSQVEPCDLLKIDVAEAKIIHVKVSTHSSTLSHLFNQGLNSIQLLLEEKESVDKLFNIIEAKKTSVEAACFEKAFSGDEFRVLYAMITHKDPVLHSDNLPMFSRLSLARTLKSLKQMRVNRGFGFIRDLNAPTVGKIKPRKSKVMPKSADDEVVEN